MWIFPAIFIFSLAWASPVYHQALPQSSRSCVPLTIQMCSDVPYNTTIYPNLLNHQNQEEASMAISQFHPLVRVKCSPDIQLFLCTVYAPVCTVLEKPIQPCRDLCLSAKHGCEQLMVKFGFRWPEQLDCERFPTLNDGICVGENRTTAAPSPSRSSAGSFECPMSMKTIAPSHSSLPMKSSTLESCSLPCEADNQYPMFFDQKTRRYLRFWTGGWSVACCICCLFTILTFLIDLGRFQYPIRPILYMAICYFVISIVYMIGVVGEEKFACGVHGSLTNLLVNQGGENVQCSVLAVFHYFFTMAAAVWWLVMCVSWYLAAKMKWGAESIENLALYFHSFAWGLPLIGTVIALILNAIDGDVFTGICSVGNLQPNSLLIFMVYPFAICIFLGFILLISGIWSMVRIRRYFKLQQSDVDQSIAKLEKLMARVSVFAILYAIPTCCSAVVLYLQAKSLPNWIEGWYGHRCSSADRIDFGFMNPRSICPVVTEPIHQPELLNFLMKYFCQLIVGIVCAIWILSTKTVISYQQACGRLFNARGTPVATTEH